MPLMRAIYKLFALSSFCPTSIILKCKLEQGSLKKVASIQKKLPMGFDYQVQCSSDSWMAEIT